MFSQINEEFVNTLYNLIFNVFSKEHRFTRLIIGRFQHRDISRPPRGYFFNSIYRAKRMICVNILFDSLAKNLNNRRQNIFYNKKRGSASPSLF